MKAFPSGEGSWGAARLEEDFSFYSSVPLKCCIYYVPRTEQIKVTFLFKRKIIVVCVYVRVGADEIRGRLAEQKCSRGLSGSHLWPHSLSHPQVLEAGSQAPPPELLV